MNKYWFKQRQTGYGFAPSTWEGWGCVVIMTILIVTLGRVNNLFTSTMTGGDVFGFFVDFIILAVLFTLFIRKRVEGGFRWQKGKKNT